MVHAGFAGPEAKNLHADLTDRRSKDVGVILLWGLGLGVTAVAPVIPHSALDLDGVVSTPPLTGTALMYSRAVLAVVMALGAATVVRSLGTRRPAGEVAVALAAVGFATGPLISVLSGGRGGLEVSGAYAPLLFAGLYFARRRPFPKVLGQLRVVMRCYTWGSLAAALIAPGWAFLMPADAGAGVGRDMLGLGWGQLSGLASNPNQLGPLMTAALLLEVVPVARKRGWPVHASAALCALVLTECRTALLGAAALLLLRGARNHTHVRKYVLWLLTGATVLFALMAPSVQAALTGLLSDPQSQDLNGRTHAWQLAYEEFRRNPLFGYGPGLFSPEHRMELFGNTASWVGQAHNQAIQTLAETGLFGAVGLTVLLATLVVRAQRISGDTAGLSTALLALLALMCTTETPLTGLSALSPTTLLLAVVWCVLLHGRPPRSFELQRNLPCVATPVTVSP